MPQPEIIDTPPVLDLVDNQSSNEARKPNKRLLLGGLAGGAVMGTMFVTSFLSTDALSSADASPQPATLAGQPPHKTHSRHDSLQTRVCTPALSRAIRHTRLQVRNGQVETEYGRPYIPYGVSIAGGLDQQHQKFAEPAVEAQIKAAPTWNSNTVRDQVNPYYLFPNENGPPNKAYIYRLRKHVNMILDRCMIPIINPQTEFSKYSMTSQDPTIEDVRFWQVVAPLFKKLPVIYDVVNEPRLSVSVESTVSSTASKATWHYWRYGGELNGVTYVGMPEIVRDIRKEGANNIAWVEAPNYSQSFQGLGNVVKNEFVQDKNVELSLHHPPLDESAKEAPGMWDKAFMFFKTAKHKLHIRLPRVVGEWAQYSSTWTECVERANKLVPSFFKYLHEHKIGLIGWFPAMLQNKRQVQPSNVVTANTPTTPRAFQRSNHFADNYNCDSPNGEGAGALIKAYFKKYSHLLNPFRRFRLSRASK